MNWEELLGRLGLSWRRRGFGQGEPVVSMALVGLNLLNMLVVMAIFGFRNLFEPEGVMLYRMGALDPMLFHAGQYWRIITYGFLHIGLMHIAFNMIALSQVGPVLEGQVGALRFLAVYLLSLIAGGAADVVVRGSSQMLIAGASGALFGLIGFGMSYAHFYGGEAGRAQRNFFLQWAAYGFLFGFIVRADNICHFGGFVAGALCGFLVERERGNYGRLTPVWGAIAVGLSLLSVGAFVWLVVANLTVMR